MLLKLRGYVALVIVCLSLIICDLVQRTLISFWVAARPSSRVSVLGKWIRFMSFVVTRPVITIGGARIPVAPQLVPSGPGTLIVMNHQSLFDIPLVVQMVDGGYPRIVTRARYKRFVPLISHMVRLYQYPVVDPTARARELRENIDLVGEAGRTSEVPMALFPEGTRTKDGEIGRFKTAGMKRLFAERPWKVYVFVADGFWQVAKFKHFIRGMWEIDGRVEHVATLEWSDTSADPTAFIDEIRGTMVDGLARIRSGSPDVEAGPVEA